MRLPVLTSMGTLTAVDRVTQSMDFSVQSSAYALLPAKAIFACPSTSRPRKPPLGQVQPGPRQRGRPPLFARRGPGFFAKMADRLTNRRKGTWILRSVRNFALLALLALAAHAAAGADKHLNAHCGGPCPCSKGCVCNYDRRAQYLRARLDNPCGVGSGKGGDV